MAPQKYGNSTAYSLKSDAERLSWAAWLLLVFFISVMGNTTILIASIKYKAIKLHKVVVTFIQHIAVCDLMITLGLSTTQSINLFANRRIFNGILCYARAHLSPFCISVSLFLICGMTVSKLLLVKFPLKSRVWTAKHAHVLCALLWTASLYSPVMALTVDMGDVFWDSRLYTCFLAFSASSWKLLLPVSVGLLVLLPTLLTIGASAALIQHLLYARAVARRTGSTVRWQGVVTVVLTATVYCVSFFPISLYLAVRSHVEDKERFIGLFRFGDAMKYSNTMANVFIYALAATSFRDFLKDRSKLWVSHTHRFGTERQSASTVV